MFTGIIETTGRVVRFERRGRGAFLSVLAPVVVSGAGEGESINVDGTCLTVTSFGGDRFTADISPETMKKSIIANYRAGREVNLERAVSPAGLLGGHIVQGHVDAVIRVRSLSRSGEYGELVVEVPPALKEYIVVKGSIALNGVSLTVAGVEGIGVSVALVPATMRGTNLGRCRNGDLINLEVDIVAKYVKSLLWAYTNRGGLYPPITPEAVMNGKGREEP